MPRQPRRSSPNSPASARPPPANLRRSPRLQSSTSTTQLSSSIRRSPLTALGSQTHPEGIGQNTQGQANAGFGRAGEEMRLPPISEGKRKGSIVWDHFTRVDAKATTATCNHCGKSVVCGNRVGTKTMLGHIHDYCKVHRVARKGAAAKSPRSEHKFSQDQSNRDFAFAVLKHNYALNMCEHIYFKHFLKGLNPYYNLPCRATLRKEIFKGDSLYACERWCHASDSLSGEKSDLEKYLAEEKYNGLVFLDVLLWWKQNHERIGGVMGKMARDLLAIPATTVASESAFSTGGKVISEERCRMLSDLVEAVVLSRDWITFLTDDSGGDGRIGLEADLVEFDMI